MVASLAPVAPSVPTHGVAITPGATVFSPPLTKIYVGATGAVEVILSGDTAGVTLLAVPAGTMLELSVTSVPSSGTTSTSLIGFY